MTRFSFGAFIGTLIQIIPTAFVVATGTVAPWARWTLGAWLALWAIVVVAKGTADRR